MRLRNVVWHPSERRPRAPVRILATLVLVVFVAGAVTLAVAGALGGTDSLLARFLASIGFTLVPGLVAVGAARWVDRRTVADLGLGLDREWWVDLGFGLALGAGLMTGVFLVTLAAGWVRVDGFLVVSGLPWGFAAGFAALALQYVAVGVAEELIMRGYLLKNLAEGAAGYVSRRAAVGFAVALSSLVFGAAHLQNPNATLVSTLGISLAGVFLATGYVLTGDLAIPIGVHVTWNLFQGGVFGFSVSGRGDTVSVIAITESGPEAVTGGAFGPEAGLLGVAAVLVGTAATVAYVRWRTGEARIDDRVTAPALRWRRVDADAESHREEVRGDEDRAEVGVEREREAVGDDPDRAEVSAERDGDVAAEPDDR